MGASARLRSLHVALNNSVPWYVRITEYWPSRSMYAGLREDLAPIRADGACSERAHGEKGVRDPANEAQGRWYAMRPVHQAIH